MRWLDATPRRAAPKGHETFILRAASTSSHRLLPRATPFRARGRKMPLTSRAPQLPQVPVNLYDLRCHGRAAGKPRDHAAAIKIILSAVIMADFHGHNNSSRAR